MHTMGIYVEEPVHTSYDIVLTSTVYISSFGSNILNARKYQQLANSKAA